MSGETPTRRPTWPWILVCLALAGLVTTGPGAAADRRLVRSFGTAEASTLALDLPAAWVELRRGSLDSVQVEMQAKCAGELMACKQQADALSVESEAAAGVLTVRLAGVTDAKRLHSAKPQATQPLQGRFDPSSKNRSWEWRWEPRKKGDWGLGLHVVVTMPARLGLDVELGRGDLVTSLVEAPARFEVGEGSLEVQADHRFVASIAVDVARGSAELRDGRGGKAAGHSRKQGLFGGRVEWQGAGTATIVAKVGRGEAVVRVQ